MPKPKLLKMLENTILKPAEKKKMLKKKVEDLRGILPRHWRMLFVHDHVAYKGSEDFLTDVLAGRSLHEPTILELESWAKEQGFENANDNEGE